MEAAEHHAESFDRLCRAVKEHWQSHDTMVLWAPDHGNHLDWDGHGNHGEWREEDINTVHFYGVMPHTR